MLYALNPQTSTTMFKNAELGRTLTPARYNAAIPKLRSNLLNATFNCASRSSRSSSSSRVLTGPARATSSTASMNGSIPAG